MLAAQMVATHEAAMECFRRAALSEQTFVGRELGLKYGDKLVRSFAALTDALNRHRGKGQQVVRVEHVTVQAGGQAIVGAVTQGGGGGHQESEDQAHAQAALAHAPEPALRGPNPQREPVPIAGGEGSASAAGCTAGPPAAALRPVTGMLSSMAATPASCSSSNTASARCCARMRQSSSGHRRGGCPNNAWRDSWHVDWPSRHSCRMRRSG